MLALSRAKMKKSLKIPRRYLRGISPQSISSSRLSPPPCSDDSSSGGTSYYETSSSRGTSSFETASSRGTPSFETPSSRGTSSFETPSSRGTSSFETTSSRGTLPDRNAPPKKIPASLHHHRKTRGWSFTCFCPVSWINTLMGTIIYIWVLPWDIFMFFWTTVIKLPPTLIIAYITRKVAFLRYFITVLPLLTRAIARAGLLWIKVFVVFCVGPVLIIFVVIAIKTSDFIKYVLWKVYSMRYLRTLFSNRSKTKQQSKHRKRVLRGINPRKCASNQSESSSSRDICFLNLSKISHPCLSRTYIKTNHFYCRNPFLQYVESYVKDIASSAISILRIIGCLLLLFVTMFYQCAKKIGLLSPFGLGKAFAMTFILCIIRKVQLEQYLLALMLFTCYILRNHPKVWKVIVFMLIPMFLPEYLPTRLFMAVIISSLLQMSPQFLNIVIFYLCMYFLVSLLKIFFFSFYAVYMHVVLGYVDIEKLKNIASHLGFSLCLGKYCW